MSDALGYGIGQGLDAISQAWQSSLARKFQEKQLQTQIEAEKQRQATQEMLARVRAEQARDVANTNAGSRRYAADQGYEGRAYAADTSADSRADAATKGLEGRKYAADTSLQGRRYAADTSLKGAKTRANATLRGAGINAGARRYAADTAAGSSAQRGLQSLYGTMFRPRNLGTDMAGKPNPQPTVPKFSDWMTQQGIGDPSGAMTGGSKAGGAVAPEHQATAADYVQKIKQAQAKGDHATVESLKKEAAKFLSTMPAAPAFPAGGGSFEDGTDDEPDDATDDSTDETDGTY